MEIIKYERNDRRDVYLTIKIAVLISLLFFLAYEVIIA